jgi:hypothetical protein
MTNMMLGDSTLESLTPSVNTLLELVGFESSIFIFIFKTQLVSGVWNVQRVILQVEFLRET